MMRGVTVRLLSVPPPVPGWGDMRADIAVGDIGYVTGACYAKRLVSVRFEYVEVWLRTSDVGRVYVAAGVAVPVTVVVSIKVRRSQPDEYAKGPVPWVDPYWTKPYTWEPARYRK